MNKSTKSELRKTLRLARNSHVLAQPETIKALLFHYPPSTLMERISETASIGLYHASADEAPTTGYARMFQQQGRTIALPRFASRDAPMTFAEHTDPFGESDLEIGPFGILQPTADAAEVTPDMLFVPLIGFTPAGDRLGQGGGHYDRWLSEHPGRLAIGLAWDMQLCGELPVEPHDIALDAVITPSRSYGL
ncbi:MAG: 5-formyltetrahydrofolate cyclo-ligase [Pseudomonadota bacterium]